MNDQRFVINADRPSAQPETRGIRPRPIRFHRTLPGYAPTPVVELRHLAERLWVRRIGLKNEEERLGLPSFKLLGSSWALHQRVKLKAGLAADALIPFSELRSLMTRFGPPTLRTASDGNHGRAVAALAEALGCGCVVFLPADSAVARIDAIKGHGASVELVEGSYDDAVDKARITARDPGHWYCPDTVGADGTEEETTFARDVMAGYATLFEEFFDQIGGAPDLLFVQAGVGGLSAAAVSSVRRLSSSARVIVVEPEGSNAIALALGTGAPVAVPDAPTVMACLRCQSVSAVAWPILQAALDAAMLITDDEAAVAVRELAGAGVVAGASGAAGLAGALVACASDPLRSRLGITRESSIAVVNTEGATDPTSYEAIISGLPFANR